MEALRGWRHFGYAVSLINGGSQLKLIAARAVIGGAVKAAESLAVPMINRVPR